MQRTIGALSARLDATLERETSLRQRLAHVEVALTAQHGDVIPGTAAPGEGLHGDGGMLAARQRIAMLEASLQACYQQLEAARWAPLLAAPPCPCPRVVGAE